MKKTVLTFGLIAGAVLSVMMLLTTPFIDRIGFDRAELIGYTTMVAAFLLIFFGIRSYRNNQGGGFVSFRKAFAVGVLISLVASGCYVATWQLVYYKIAPDFVDRYAANMIEKERAAGATAPELEATAAQMQKFRDMYRNPLVNVAVTFLEVFPIGAIVALVSAGILRRRRKDAAAGLAERTAGALAGLV